MQKQFFVHVLPVVLLVMFLALPAFSQDEKTGTIVLENRGDRPVWVYVKKDERQIEVYPWGLEDYRRITSNQTLTVDGSPGVWEVRMKNASGGVGFALENETTMSVRFNSPGEQKIMTSVYREDVKISFHEFEKQKTSSAGGTGHLTTYQLQHNSRNRSDSDTDRFVADKMNSRDKNRSRRSYSDSDRSYTQTEIYYVDEPEWGLHRKRYHHSYRYHRYHDPFWFDTYRRHYRYRRHHRHHRPRVRFRLGYHFGGHHDGFYYGFGIHH